jgi:hypothetical protein
MTDLSDQLAALVDRATPVVLDDVLMRPLPVGPSSRPWRRAAAVAAAVALVVVGVGGGALLLRGDADRSDVVTEPSVNTTTSPPVTTPDSTVVPVVPPPTSSTTTPPTVPGLDRRALSTAGIGDLRFGATVEAAEAITGVRAEPSIGCSAGHLATITLDGAALLFYDGRFEWWAVSGPGWSTLSGIEVGTPASEAVALVPELERVEDELTSDLVLPPLPTRLLIGLDDADRVETMHASFGSDLTPIWDPC